MEEVDWLKGLHEIYRPRRAIPAREEDTRGSDPSILARIAYLVTWFSHKQLLLSAKFTI